MTRQTPPYVQRLEESIGKFLIGLSGDLENAEFEDESDDDAEVNGIARSATQPVQTTSRVFLRTLLVEMSTSRFSERSAAAESISQPGRSDEASDSAKGKTSAGASVDGAQPVVTHERVQVAVYVHQPFIFVFLFQLHTPNLTMPAFYQSIHHTLGPLQKSLLSSTAPERLKERMRETLAPATNVAGSLNTAIPVLESYDMTEMYDLLYDSSKSTIRTSIPNIPLPGSLAAEGFHGSAKDSRPITVSGSWYTLGIPIGSSSTEGATSSSGNTTFVRNDWTRVEALNVHTHILNTWTNTRDKQAGLTYSEPRAEDFERTVKTARGWWIVWMKLLPSKQHDFRSSSELVKEAFLVRRSRQERSLARGETSSSGSDIRSAGRWLFRELPRSREFNGSQSVTSSPAGPDAKGVAEGMGVDAKKWVEALAKLSL